MKKCLFFFLLFHTFLTVCGQSFSVLTWNIQNLGGSKDANEIAVIVEVLKSYDIVAIQEVVAKDPAGAQTVAKIADALNRTGTKWDYRVSHPTHSPSVYKSERYAFLWKTATINLIGSPLLDKGLEEICDREPFIGQFQPKNSSASFYLVNFHSRKYSDHPEEEIQYFDAYPKRLETNHVLIAGDFNLTETHQVWNTLYAQGFETALENSPTTLKQKCTEEGIYVNHAIDNIFYNKSVFQCTKSGRIDFVGNCENLKEARGISDHLPVYMEILFR